MVKRIDIGNTDENADWIKSLPGHKDELEIHDALAKKKRGKKARPNRKQCMAADCTSAPVIDVQWADGRGRAWFCLPHFEAWASEAQREIVRAWFVEGGEVPKKVRAYDRSAQVRVTGSGVGPKEIADRIRKLVQKRDKPKGAKAADEPPPNVRGQPLPEEEATEGWEITEEDIAAGQAWVDKAMKEAGFRD